MLQRGAADGVVEWFWIEAGDPVDAPPEGLNWDTTGEPRRGVNGARRGAWSRGWR